MHKHETNTYGHNNGSKGSPAEVPEEVWFSSNHAFNIPSESTSAVKPRDCNGFKEADPQQRQSRSGIKVHDLK